MRRILILDMGLILLLFFAGKRVRDDWKNFETVHQIDAIKPHPETMPGLPASGGTAAATSLAEWTAIPSQNLFSFDRTDVTIAAAAEPVAATAPGPKPFLFGTMQLGDAKLAMLGTGQSGNRNYRPMKVGESIDGWKLVSIDEKAVVVESNTGRETILANDPTAQVPRDHTRTLATSETAPAVQSVSQSNTAPRANGTSTPQPVGTSVAPQPSYSNSNTTNSSGEMRVWMTPFGPKLVPKDPPE